MEVTINEIAVVIIAYNRPASLIRLLASLEKVRTDSVINLFIMIDGGGHPDVVKIAEKFHDPKFKTIVHHNAVNLGLKQNVLSSADIVDNFDAIIMLEDDLTVTPDIINYSISTINHFAQQKNVAGFALYAPEFNEFAKLPFIPLQNGYDNYPMQVGCSWGQIWTKRQWQNFRSWLNHNKQFNPSDLIPTEVNNWPDSSWKKSFNLYLTEKNEYIIYPYESLTTNHATPGGTHVKANTTLYQVKLPYKRRRDGRILHCSVECPEISYDAFMEQSGTILNQCRLTSDSRITQNLYNLKSPKYLANFTHAVVIDRSLVKEKSFSLTMLPLEQNYLQSNYCVRDSIPTIKVVECDRYTFQSKPDRILYSLLMNMSITNVSLFKCIILSLIIEIKKKIWKQML